jgi:hypothetical protein
MIPAGQGVKAAKGADLRAPRVLGGLPASAPAARCVTGSRMGYNRARVLPGTT